MSHVRRALGRYPGSLLAICLILLGVSLLTLGSASMAPDGSMLGYLKRQVIWASAGLGIFFTLSLIPYDRLTRRAPWVYLLGLVALGFVFVIGTKVNGARRWFALGPIRIQPSEFMKYALILTLARAIAVSGPKIQTWRGLAEVGVIAGIPFLMVAAQPDLGTSLTFVPITLAMIVVAGARFRHLFTLGLSGLACLPVAWLFLLRDYQKDRILSFLSPAENELAGAYQTTQSVIAIGNGGLLGQGYRQGTQGPLGFLPERHTDFIYAVVCEDFGLVGGILLLGLYGLLFCTLAKIASRCRDPEGRLLVTGVLAVTIMQVGVNVGMALGVAPVTGLTLPLVSYGGSSLLAVMVGFGLAASVASTRVMIWTPAGQDAEPRKRPRSGPLPLLLPAR